MVEAKWARKNIHGRLYMDRTVEVTYLSEDRFKKGEFVEISWLLKLSIITNKNGNFIMFYYSIVLILLSITLAKVSKETLYVF